MCKSEIRLILNEILQSLYKSYETWKKLWWSDDMLEWIWYSIDIIKHKIEEYSYIESLPY